MKYSLIENESGRNLTVLLDGELYPASSEHPNFEEILEKVRAGDEEGLVDLFDPSVKAARKFRELGERVTMAGSQVFFDGDPVDNTLANQIARFVKEDVEDWQPLVAFYDKLMTNANEHSRYELYRWLSDRDFEIDADGDFYAYKGVRNDLTSINSGPAVVDGEEMTGHIPNNVGSVISMPRSMVQFDSSIGCSTGLHAGTWDYAKDFAQGKVLKVKINPRDVVSVPTDCNDQKLRVCRYLVTEVVEEKSNAPVSVYAASWNYSGYDADYEGDDYAY